ncbi:MAG: 4-hydroxythreonine-4-phosphate dehydrogenase PdxA [Myxococcota bacterium]
MSRPPAGDRGATASVRLAISMGCPAGIGPEVAVLAASRADVPTVLVGDEATLVRAATLRGVDAGSWIRLTTEDAFDTHHRGVAVWSRPDGGALGAAGPPAFGAPRPVDGAAQLAAVDEALRLVRTGRADALVTGPVAKSVIAASGAPGAASFLGHTEYIASALSAPEPTMTFVDPKGLSVALVTTHLALRHVPDAITVAGVAASTYWLVDMLGRLLGRAPRVVVTALNPHAGESGLLGREEAEVIAPGVAAGRARLAAGDVPVAALDGPIGAESAFRHAQNGRYDGVVAMYHDQATIPAKLLGFGDAVNVTLGLPVTRTSVDHGTAYDVAGSGQASSRGMEAAVALAVRLASSKR